MPSLAISFAHQHNYFIHHWDIIDMNNFYANNQCTILYGKFFIFKFMKNMKKSKMFSIGNSKHSVLVFLEKKILL